MGPTVDQIAALDPRKNDHATSYPRGTNHPGVELCHQRSGQDRLRANGFIDRHVFQGARILRDAVIDAVASRSKDTRSGSQPKRNAQPNPVQYIALL